MMNKYAEEIRKNEKSIKYFGQFQKDYVPINKVSIEELFIGYYRAMQVWLLPKQIRPIFMWSAVRLGKIRTIKALQKVIDVKADGVMGPLTRSALDNVDLESFTKEIRKPKNKIVLIWRLLMSIKN